MRRPTPHLPRRRPALARTAGGALVATLIAAEAAARVEANDGTEPSGADPLADAPAASSLADILDLAEICATRPAFAGLTGHDHDYFRPSFSHRGRHVAEHDARGGAEHAGAGSAGANHDGPHAAVHVGAPRTGDASDHADPSADGASHEGDPAGSPVAHDHQATPGVPGAPAFHAHELFLDHRHDLDAGLDALLASIHGSHDKAPTAAATDPGPEPPVQAITASSDADESAEERVVGHSHAAAMEAPPEPVLVIAEI